MDWVGALRAQLRERAEALPAAQSPLAYRSLGRGPVVLFRQSEDGRAHSNFLPAAWAAIVSNPKWQLRLNKAHSQVAALPLECRSGAKELDSTNSSDALLMNVFCFPGASAKA